jgi:mannose-6-phosphate isomerase-like protein (cupin superfamily)|tara:strand:+ start:4661 stop:5029 length:369 start_codon:yes stop_codon:yes gene_type:complete
MIYNPINLDKKFKKFSDYWSPKVIGEMNNYQFKLAKVQGEFIWHQHLDTDETFIVIEGQLTIEFKDGRVDIGQGEMYVVPKGVEHKPMATKECHIMIIEPKGVTNTGNKMDSKLKADNDVWI